MVRVGLSLSRWLGPLALVPVPWTLLDIHSERRALAGAFERGISAARGLDPPAALAIGYRRRLLPAELYGIRLAVGAAAVR